MLLPVFFAAIITPGILATSFDPLGLDKKTRQDFIESDDPEVNDWTFSRHYQPLVGSTKSVDYRGNILKNFRTTDEACKRIVAASEKLLKAANESHEEAPERLISSLNVKTWDTFGFRFECYVKPAHRDHYVEPAQGPMHYMRCPYVTIPRLKTMDWRRPMASTKGECIDVVEARQEDRLSLPRYMTKCVDGIKLPPFAVRGPKEVEEVFVDASDSSDQDWDPEDFFHDAEDHLAPTPLPIPDVETVNEPAWMTDLTAMAALFPISS